MVEELVLVVAVALAVALGYLLGMAQAREELAPQLPLESQTEWEQMEKSKMRKAMVSTYSALLAREKAQALVLQSELDSLKVAVQDSELELVRVKAQAQRAELALEELRYRNQETDWRGHH